MSDLDDNLEKLEEAKDALAKKKFTVLGFSFNWTGLVVAGGVVSSALGTLYAGFLMYQKVEEIANLDVGAFEQRMELIEQKVTAVDENTAAIKVDLKGDIRRIQNVVDAVERNSKDSARSVNEDLRGFRQDIKTLEREVDTRLKETEKNLTDKLQKALDNPLAGN